MNENLIEILKNLMSEGGKMNDPTVLVAAIMSTATEVASETFDDMSEEDCVLMVRGFVETMRAWQPNLEEMDGPQNSIELAVACLSLAKLFLLAFEKSYVFTDKRFAAEAAIKNALGNAE